VSEQFSPRLCFLSGGTGTPKLLRGYSTLSDNFSVIVNVAEDVWVSGNKVCPDIDSVIYAIADVIDDTKWWGVRGDTFRTYERLKEIGFDEGMMIGDIDRATHIARSEMLRRGITLTEATRRLARAVGVKEGVEVLPACEEEVSTYIKTPEGWLHFQEFWVARRGEPEVLGVEFRGIERAKITEDVRKAVEESNAVVIGPSNPITSITPILEVRGMRELLKEKFVVAVSPIVGRRAVSGPAAKLMRAVGYEVSADGVAECYSDFLDLIVVHEGDECGWRHVDTNVLMESREDEIRLAKFIIKLVESELG